MGTVTVYILFGSVFFSALIALSWIDIKTFRLPNFITLPLIGLGFLFSFSSPYGNLVSSLIGAVVGFTGFIFLEYAFRHFYKKEGLGRGDAKLLAAGGAWCYWFGLPYIVLIASLCGLVFTQMPSFKNKAAAGDPNIPFGPFLSFGIAVIWLGQAYFVFF